MTSKATSETNFIKWKLKSGDSKSDTELQIYKKENAALKKSLEEIIKGKGKMTSEEKKRLLEKILALETENEKHKSVLGEKDKEIRHLKDELKKRSKSGDLANLHNQLEEKNIQVAKREQLLTSVLEEVERLKNELATKCAELENRAGAVQVSQETGQQRNVNEVEIQLKDALEKNHQWLIYDQQRETYVQGLLGRIFELEQQIRTTHQQEVKETQTEEQQMHYIQQLAAARNDVEIERLAVAQLHSELDAFKKRHDETQQEMAHLNVMKVEQQANMQTLQDENHSKGEIIQRLTDENKLAREKLEEERKRTEALVSQVELLHRALLRQQEENDRIAALEQQKLPEPTRIEVLHNFQAAFEDKMVIQEEHSSPTNLHDESFLECPKCKALYPTSQHRELLVHIDFCAV
ncbi:centrosomal protein of 55 kDa isoform X2 [Sphaerodactylus townsendi]|uniref:centrosomal protein of 55 kDa isoform X2 n=1 Tax=Sphaerodactylus townsendi TaxID=933632 RepID=UPI00202651CE|nr:centrosomal protein of 55 kDa isoform X2 [Sphaerodactylus townsendi]